MLIAEAARGETRVPPVVFVLENSHGRDAHDTFSKLSMENGFDRLSCFTGGQQLCTSGIGARISDVTRANHVSLKNSHNTIDEKDLYLKAIIRKLKGPKNVTLRNKRNIWAKNPRF
jgi:hypothetical protein